MTSGDSMALPTSPALTYSIGRFDHPPTYYEVLTPAAGSTKPPVVMIHGGAHTGACYLATPDGRQGWAHVFVAQGYQVVVPDWPGAWTQRLHTLGGDQRGDDGRWPWRGAYRPCRSRARAHALNVGRLWME